MFGDPTAKKLGRITLNPLKHLDRAGTIVFLVSSIGLGFGIGWAKPVPVDGRYFANPRRDMAIVSLAGPAMNFALAAVAGLSMRLLLYWQLLDNNFLGAALFWFAFYNILLGVFNLIPIPPLDGSRLVSALLPVRMLQVYEKFEGYGIAIVFTGMFFFRDAFWGVLTPFINFFQRLFLV